LLLTHFILKLIKCFPVAMIVLGYPIFLLLVGCLMLLTLEEQLCHLLLQANETLALMVHFLLGVDDLLVFHEEVLLCALLDTIRLLVM